MSDPTSVYLKNGIFILFEDGSLCGFCSNYSSTANAVPLPSQGKARGRSAPERGNGFRARTEFMCKMGYFQ